MDAFSIEIVKANALTYDGISQEPVTSFGKLHHKK